MIKRPKPSDTEEDILEMQRKFLEEKSKNVNLQPAAKLTKIDKRKYIFMFMITIKVYISLSVQLKNYRCLHSARRIQTKINHQ